MLLNELMKVDGDVFLIEGSFEGIELNLKSLDYMDKLRSLPEGSVPAAMKISDRKGDMLGAAFQNSHPEGDFWFVIPCPHALQARRQTELMVNDILGSDVVASLKSRKIDAPRFRASVREYLSVSLVERSLCDCTRDIEPMSFAKNDERDRSIKKLIALVSEKYGLEMKKTDALEICCGNGMSTRPLNGIFHSVMSVDNDKCAVCNGLYHGTLQPESTMVIDAMRLTQYGLERFGCTAGFMLGTIYEFNKPVWRKIFEQALRVTNGGGLLLFTVNQKEEMDFLRECYASMGIEGEVIDNRQKDSIYDSWAFVAVKNADR